MEEPTRSESARTAESLCAPESSDESDGIFSIGAAGPDALGTGKIVTGPGPSGGRHFRLFE